MPPPSNAKPNKPDPNRKLLQHYEVVVQKEPEGEVFEANLLDRTNKGTLKEDLWAEIYVNKIKPEERDKLKPGYVFDWYIYEDGMEIKWYDLGTWTKEELEEIRERAKKWANFFS